MTAQISAYGRLVADPQTRTTGKGTNMAMVRLAVSLPCNAAEDGEATFWLGVIAFGKQADALAKHRKGELVSVAGNMQINQWTGQDGGTQQGFRSLRTVYSAPERYAQEVKRGSRDKPQMPYVGPMSNVHQRLVMRILTRRHRMTNEGRDNMNMIS